MAFVELYKEDLCDLLCTKGDGMVDIREHPDQVGMATFPGTTVHIFFNTTLDARWDLRAPREPVGQNESNDTTPRSLYVGRNFTLYDVTVSR